jgi:hypothetical protein
MEEMEGLATPVKPTLPVVVAVNPHFMPPGVMAAVKQYRTQSLEKKSFMGVVALEDGPQPWVRTARVSTETVAQVVAVARQAAPPAQEGRAL